MERKRSDMYYLDKAFQGHYALGSDGAVSDVYEVEMRETKRVLSRVPGLYREVESSEVHAPQYGHGYSSLRELASRVDNPLTAPLHKFNQIDESELIYTPADIVSDMRRWQFELSERINTDSVIEVASDMVATIEQLSNERVDCKNCPSSEEYACYNSGWSRQFWKYPMIDIGDDKQELVPFDVAKAISISPDALEVEEIYMDDHQELSYTKRVILDMSKISAVYAGGEADKYLTINKSDRLSAARIAMETGFWAEDTGRRHPMNNDELFGNIKSGEDIINAMQNIVTQGGERVEIADYDKVWSRVRADLGRRSLWLMWNWQYNGMGDSGADVHVVKDDDITKSLYISNELEARMMVDSVYDRLVRGLDEPRRGRPIYDDIEEGK